MPWEKVDSVLLTNHHYYWKNPMVNKYLQAHEGFTPSEEFEGTLILRKGKKPLWVSHPFNYAQAKKQLFGVEVKRYKNKKEFQRLLGKAVGRKVGYDGRYTTVNGLKCLKKLFPAKKFINVSLKLEATREVKEKNEINKIETAVQETKKVLEKVINGLEEGASENETSNLIKEEFEKRGFGCAFCIVAFGADTAHIHHISTHKKLHKEMPVLIDCGAKYKGYVADISRSFWFGSKPTKGYLVSKRKVETALESIEKKLYEEAKVHDLWIETKALGKMPHALGHGIGLEEHDFPAGIGEKCKWNLKENMVLALEPAIYTKKFGVRIENDYLITKKGFKKL